MNKYHIMTTNSTALLRGVKFISFLDDYTIVILLHVSVKTMQTTRSLVQNCLLGYTAVRDHP
jgi:hypothetical protein